VGGDWAPLLDRALEVEAACSRAEVEDGTDSAEMYVCSIRRVPTMQLDL
jgi:hypothetical protein